MEAVLDLYAEPLDPARPQVCFDEKPVQFLGHVRPPQPVQPGTPARQDYEYERRGTGSLLGFIQPLGGWRHIEVSDQRTKVDFARMMRSLVDEHFPEATVIRVVLDNLNTHTFGALYEAFPAAEARRIAKKLEFQYTPTHASWLNMIELEFSVLERQCLGRRLPDAATMQQEIAAWEAARNAAGTTVQWRFTTDAARAKLAKLYPPHSLR